LPVFMQAIKPAAVVSVAFPMAISGLYDYQIPPEFYGKITPGTPLRVSLRNAVTWGVAVDLKSHSPHGSLKPVLEIMESRWTDSTQSLLKLYKWIAAYYQCDLGAVFKPLVRKRLLQTSLKTIAVYAPASGGDQGLSDRQAAAFRKIKDNQEAFSAAELRRRHGISSHMLTLLTQKGKLNKMVRQVLPAGAAGGAMVPSPAEYTLSGQQQQVFETLLATLNDPQRPVLLFGITGSGKTLVYIEIVKAALAKGKSAIILVPEISLTPQTIGRFSAVLGPTIAVIHSRMSDGERRESIAQLVTGQKRVAIGVRSVVLVPLDNVGVIIVDEEHDASYKQYDPEPRYQARDVAVMRGMLSRALVVLGSATPSVESLHNALAGKYDLARLTQRHGPARLPPVQIIDMSEEHAAGNWTLLSRYLQERMTAVLEQKRQIILLLNRRGFATMLLCRDCGYSAKCPACSVHVVFHKEDQLLKCHQCGFTAPAPVVCPKCKGSRIKYSGTGIQKAQEHLAANFPGARIIRMDQDTTRKQRAHDTIISAFARGEADILLGTQMVAKGLDFPGVTLVGVIQADIGLHFPDFRASERTFSLLTQVGGRAGRSDDCGEVVIQTYMPQEPAILAAQQHDYETFFNTEITQRRALHYPPFGKLARIVLEGPEGKLLDALMQKIVAIVRATAPSECAVLGPTPAVIARVKNNDRLSLLLKSTSSRPLQLALTAVRAAVRPARTIKMIVDVDPVNMI
ncbi:MAG: primosomal protein N', partial [Chitinivibrionales bacterium]|nr:primosomal protein N' [Chitinivibrionales bacterium]